MLAGLAEYEAYSVFVAAEDAAGIPTLVQELGLVRTLDASPPAMQGLTAAVASEAALTVAWASPRTPPGAPCA